MSITNIPDNPYVGLRPFESHQSILFFGRNEQITDLLTRLNDTRFVAVVGSSGSGKSSLIRAGLIPKLKAGFLVEERDRWHIAKMKPGKQPLYNLAASMLAAVDSSDGDGEADPETVNKLLDDIRTGGLAAALDFLRPVLKSGDSSFLLLVDQFEEIFRFILDFQNTSERNDADEFVSLMLQLVEQRELPVFVVMTMRSDFIGDCDTFYGLPEALNRSQYLVPRVTRKQRREVIEGPVILFGRQISPSLVNRVLNDIGDSDDQLPILQHAMMRTWENFLQQGRDSREPLDMQEYQAAGTVKNALSNHANEALESMDSGQQALTRRIFQSLTDIDSSNRRIRRPARLKSLMKITGASRKEILDIVEHFRSDGRFFLVLSGDPTGKDPLIDISHESLIRQWERLRNWVDEEGESRRRYLLIAEAGRREKSGQGGLWRDPELSLALNWRDEQQPTRAWAEQYHPDFDLAMDFLDRSRAAAVTARSAKEKAEQERLAQAQALAEAESKRAEEQAASAAQFRRIAILMGLLMLLSLALMGYAWWQRGVANEARLGAVEAQQAAEQSAIEARKAEDIANEQRRQADSLRIRDRLQVVALEAQQQLILKKEAEALAAAEKEFLARKSLQKTYEKLLAEQQAKKVVEEIASSYRKSTFSIALSHFSRQKQRQGSPEFGAVLARYAYEYNRQVNDLFSDQVYDAMRNALNDPRIKAGGPDVVGSRHSGWVRGVVYSPNGRWIASGSGDGLLRLWKAGHEGSPAWEFDHKAGLRAIAFNDRGDRFASADESGRLILWSMPDSSGKLQKLAEGASGGNRSIWTIVFSKDDRHLYAAGKGQGLHIWRVSDLSLQDTLDAGMRTRAIDISADGNWLASGGDDGMLRIWQRNAAGALTAHVALKAHSGGLSALRMHPGLDRLASGGEDGRILIWDLDNGHPTLRDSLVGHQSRITALDYNPKGSWLASASLDKSVRIWNVGVYDENEFRFPIYLQEHEAWVWSVAFSPDGKNVVSASADRSILEWIADPQILADEIQQRFDLNLSPDNRQLYLGGDSLMIPQDTVITVQDTLK